MEQLYNKYRPTDFNSVVGQNSITTILNKQIETNNFKNCYLFSGPSGCGKTTIARIFANKLNKQPNSYIEIDGASNNGVDHVRDISDDSDMRAIGTEFKIYIIDECHMITTQGWNAFLKTIEEPPEFTIFIFCTTDFYKVPQTIRNRCQVFRLGRIKESLITDNLINICLSERFNYDPSALEYIAKLADGSMRQAISYLDKCKDYSTDINLKNVTEVLGEYDYDIFINLTNSKIDGRKEDVIKIIEGLYSSGTDLKLFIDKYFEFILDLYKYCIFNDYSITKLPSSLKDQVNYCVGIEDKQKFFKWYLDRILEIKLSIKNDSNIKTTTEVLLIK